jgi:proline iminopeptidase
MEIFPEIEPYDTGTLQVDDLHTLYYEQCGNPAGVPAVFVHGGPGGGCGSRDRRFFDPAFYRIILFDQRGAGRSTPLGEITNNTTQHLAEDMEKLREHLDVDHWHVFGGSWGSTLSLYYAEAFPERVMSLTLRGIFLMTQRELDWWFAHVQQFFPEHWEAWRDHLDEHERHELPEAYHRKLTSNDPTVRQAAAEAWARYEASCCTLRPNPEFLKGFMKPERALGLARIESHYFRNNRFEPDDLLLRNVDKIRHIPGVIVQGRYDVICPPLAAFTLAKQWPEATLVIVEDAGHSSWEPGISSALVEATEKWKSLRS